MKILQMSRCFFPYQAGASVRTYQIAKNLVKRGHEVHLLLHHPKSIGHALEDCEVKSEETVDGIKVSRLKYIGPSYLYFTLVIGMMAKRAVKIIKEENTDVILAHNPPYIVGLSALKASRITGKPLVLNLHDPWGSTHHNFFEYNMGMFLEKLCTRKADSIVTASKTIPRTLKERHGIPESKCYVAPNAVDVERFDVDAKEVEESRKKYNIPKGKPIVMFMGSLAKWNGVQHLVGAAKYLKDANVVLVGGGRHEEELREMAKGMENVIFTGLVPYEEVPNMLAMADVCVAPFPKVESVGWEGYEAPVPHLLLEYMASGKPIVGSDVHVIGELLSGGRGVKVKPEDAKAIADGVKKVLSSKKSAEMSIKAKDYIKKDLNWMGVAEIVEKALQDAIDLRAGRRVNTQ
jgi:glycosyltransferase involved in cell wall biosynthesis